MKTGKSNTWVCPAWLLVVAAKIPAFKSMQAVIAQACRASGKVTGGKLVIPSDKPVFVADLAR
jgi:hypothetical protein